jgi:hypothetical protein
MVQPILDYAPLISIAVASGLLAMAFVAFSNARRNSVKQSEYQMDNLRIQNEQLIYARIMDIRLKLESTPEFTEMAKESPIFVERFALVDNNPNEYYTISAFLDLFEYVFYLKNMYMIEEVIWNRWKILTETIMNIPKFKTVWNNTKNSHPDEEFRRFIDSTIK